MVKLSRYFGGHRRAKKCWYTYDFGDSWTHEVKLRAKIDHADSFQRRLLAGERAGPMEDCGGVSGYERFAEFVQTGKDPYGEDAEELSEWVGDWRPEVFDLEAVKKKFDT